MEYKQALKRSRAVAGMTQAEAAAKLGVAQSTISCWERGKSVPSVSDAISMSHVYGLPLDKLLGLEPLV